jgi:hypothetical protein
MRLINRIVILILIAFFSHAQIPSGVSYDTASGNYHARFHDNVKKQQFTWIFEPATKLHPFVEVNIDFDPESGTFRYEYTLRNGKNSEQNLIEFSLETENDYITQSSPSKEWKIERYSELPVIGWVFNYTEKELNEAGIKPGRELDKFVLISKGLPTLLKCYFSGSSHTRTVPQALPDEMRIFFDDIMHFPKNMVRRGTIGPAEDIAGMNSIAIIDTLLSITDRALSLRWSKRVRKYRDITQHLNDAKDLLKIESETSALNRLNHLLRILENYEKDGLSQELYMLYVHHVRYLVSRYP